MWVKDSGGVGGVWFGVGGVGVRFGVGGADYVSGNQMTCAAGLVEMIDS